MTKTVCIAMLILALCVYSAGGRASAGGLDGLPHGSMRAQSEEKIDSLQVQMERNSLGKLLSDHIFAARLDTVEDGTGAAKSEDPYIPYAGKYIRHIEVYRYNIFSDTEVGSKNHGQPGFVRAIEWVHADTRISKIVSYLLFEEGDPVDPYSLADSERLLREANAIQDAIVRIVPISGNPDSVDVQVLSRDVWSIGANAAYITAERYRFIFYEKNLAGYGHTLAYELSLDLDRDRMGDHTVYYGASNIYGTFVDGEIRLVDADAYRYNQWTLMRRYVSPEIRWTGGVSVEGMDDPDEDPAENSKWDREDVWLGRAFRVDPVSKDYGSRTRIIPGIRATRTDYHVRPPVAPDIHRSYHDRTLYLGNINLTRRSFRKMRMVFSFGRTEDIPRGMLATATAGIGDFEFFSRPYASFEIAHADFYGSSGYFTARGALGSYFRYGSSEDGTIAVTLGAFSSLLHLKGSMMRHFFVADYLKGFNRLPVDNISLDEPYGELTGMNNTGVKGKERLVLSWEGVLFIDWDWFGFRFATFAYAQAGQVGPDWNSFLFGKYYFSLGGGLRVHNERLIFDAYEMRFMHHPIVPEGADTGWFKLEAVKRINIPFLSPAPPRVLRYD